MKSNTAIVCLSPYAGGMEFDSIRLYQLLSSEANVFHVVRKGSRLEKLSRENVRDEHVYAIPFTFNFGPSLVFNFRRLIKEKNIKNVVYFGASELVSLYVACLKLKLNFIVRHGTTKSHSKKDLYHQLIYSRVNWHIAVSDHILRNVKQICPISKRTRCKRIYLSRDINDVKAVRDDDNINIIHVGRINPGKGQRDALVALKNLKDNGIEFEANFLGSIDDQNYFEELKRLVNQYRMTDRVHFRGHVEDVIGYLKNSDIFLFPSHGEGMPNALIESMAVGLVPVTYDNTVFPEVQQLGFHIVLAADRDTDMLSDLVYDVATNLPDHLEKSKANSKKYQQFFTPRVEKEHYLRVLI